MEHGTVADSLQDEFAAKNRFESFKLGKGLPASVAQKHSHARSHSRNNSSVSLPFSTSTKSMNVADTSAPVSPTPPSKRHSHHRRRSSVSTRIESAEMMGVSIPDLPSSTSEDNINLGEKDSIRRRALWALEGKPDVAFSKVEIPELSTPVMEKMMFDLASKPSQTQNITPSYGPSINTLLANKRDSFKLLGPSSSSKDQLHTLVEEEEEEDEAASVQHEAKPSSQQTVAPKTPDTPAVEVMTTLPIRSRPANLNLRPLSLTPDNSVSMATELSIPSVAPVSRVGLKALALVPSGEDSSSVARERSSASPMLSPHRPSLTLKLTSDVSSSTKVERVNRCSSISYKSSTHNEEAMANYGLPTPDTATHPTFDRRYSISDAFRRRSSSSSSTPSTDEDSFPTQPSQLRPLSASEQHFLFKSHNALLARIQDLERALSMRRMSSGGASNVGSSRPGSVVSDFSTSDLESNGEPSDELLRLVADLKAERDELKRDVEGWRTRVADMEKQHNILAGRVESERRDAWVARSMSGLLEQEKVMLECKLACVEKTVLALEADKEALKLENAKAKKRIVFLEVELNERKSTATASNQEILSNPSPRTPESRPRPVGFITKRFTSVDSDVTEVDSLEDVNPKFNSSLKSVSEGEEEVSEEDNGLAGYEDEEESDITFQSSSSFGSEDDLPRSIAHLQDVPISVTSRSNSPSSDHNPLFTHTKSASLSKTWSFPMSAIPGKQVAQVEPDVDRFFGCLEDNDDHENNDSVPNSPSAYSYEKSKSLFASGFKYNTNDEDSPFFFPFDDGVEVGFSKTLEVVREEEEEEEEVSVQADEDMFAGGIHITFTPPEADEDESLDLQRSPSPSPVRPSIPTLHFFDFDEEEPSVPFNFGRPISSVPEELIDDDVPSAPPAPEHSSVQSVVEHVVRKSDPIPVPSMITPPPSLPRPRSPQPSFSRSSIPRAKVVKPFPFVDCSASTPPRPTQSRAVSDPIDTFNAYVTPPSRRRGNLPSLIPQAISSPSPLRSFSTGAKPKTATAPTSTFIKQPQRKPLMLTNSNTKSQKTSGVIHGSNFLPCVRILISFLLFSERYHEHAFFSQVPEFHSSLAARKTHSEMKSIDLSSDHFVINTTDISASTTTITPSQSYPRNYSSPETPAARSVEAPLSLSSFSSIMTSPLSSRILFPSFTNLISLSWSQRNIAPEASAVVVGGTQKADSVLDSRGVAQARSNPSKRGFVSKEKQLEKLRCRLEQENPAKVKSSISVWCKNCDDGQVVL
ncbi:hypothetical protein H2248_005950 [Termitomyces sp. 'cryptogamus']|nr:hypothetical protein H2248_005950 [Termitomyces sp. 'cryptogamus']